MGVDFQHILQRFGIKDVAISIYATHKPMQFVKNFTSQLVTHFAFFSVKTYRSMPSTWPNLSIAPLQQPYMP
jgi:hypothetical protein